jgi:hypothetical protein
MDRVRVIAGITRAYGWLDSLSLGESALQDKLLVALAAFAVEAVADPNRRFFVDFTLSIDEVSESQFGDAAVALCVYLALCHRGIRHGGLCRMTRGFAEALAVPDPGLGPQMNLVGDLIRRCGFRAPEPVDVPSHATIISEGLIAASRSEVIEACRSIGCMTSFGTRGELSPESLRIIPPLAMSYAMEWDIGVVSLLIRTAAFLGLAQTPALGWAIDWLLDQQHSDGRFGLLCEERQARSADRSGGIGAHLDPTVGAILALAEVSRPHFLLRA